MKSRINNKKLISLILLILMIFTNVQPIFAMSGSGTFVSGQWASYIKTTDNANTQYGVLLRKIINSNTGEQKTVFCAEHGVDIYTSVRYNGTYYTPTNSTLRKACKIAYLGWYSKYGDYVVDGGVSNTAKTDYVLTQQFIWETLGQSNATFIDSNLQAQYESLKSSINNQIAQIERRPSFDGTTINIQAGESKVLNDTNGVLASYLSTDNSTNGIRVTHQYGSNEMTIYVDENTSLENYILTDSDFLSWGMIKDGTQDKDSMVFFEFEDGVQNQLYCMAYNDPITLSVGLKIETFGKLEIKKLNTNGDLVDGAVFNVTGPNGYNQDVTVSNGKITIEKLRKGTYTIKEKSAPYGYLLNNQAFNVEVKVNQTASQAVVNDEPTGTIKVVKKSEQGDLIKDTVFKVIADEDIKNVAGTKTYYTKGQVVANITTNNNGLAEIINLPLGKYIVEETQAANGYLLDSTKHNVSLSYKGQTEKIVVESFEKIDSTPTGEIKVYKFDNYNNQLNGAEISLYAREDIKNVAGTKTWYKKGDLVSKQTTQNDGSVTFSDLHLGSYYVKETNAPTGFLLNNQEFDVKLLYKDQTTKLISAAVNKVINLEPTGTISIEKKDNETGFVAQGDATLKGAIYKIYAKEDIYNVLKTKKFYSKDDLVATRTIDENGKTEDVTNLPLGNYYIKETTASTGYLLDNNVYEISLKYKDQNTKIITDSITSKEQVKKQQIHIFKSGIKEQSGQVKGLEGAEFTIKLFKDVEKALGSGYKYEEIWNGIDEYGNTVQVDSKRVSEAQVIAPSYTTIRTDENGDAYTDKLPYGKYMVKETLTPKDYFSAEDFTFTITNDESEITEIAKKVRDIVVNNEQMEAYIKLVKKDFDSDKNVSLSSATFQIKATKDIYDRGNNKIVYKKGEVITQKIGSTVYNSFTTNADNIIIPDGSYSNKKEDKGIVITPLKLPVGTYEISEIQIPKGFLQLDETVKFSIQGIKNYDTDNEGDYIKEVIVKNAQPKGTLVINKIIELRKDVDKSIVDISDLSGIQFKLVANENIIDYADGSIVYEKGQEVGKYNLDKNGNLKIENLWMGEYELSEIKTINGLVLNNEKYIIRFTQEDISTKIYEIDKDITNNTTCFEFSKTDVTGENEILGAKLKVIDKDNKVIDEWTSTEKTHKIEGLNVNEEYTLIEEIAPKDYVKATEIKFKVENTKDIQKVIMIDKIVDMSKINVGGEEIEGATIQVLDKDGNIIDEWVSAKEPHIIKGLEEKKSYILHEEITADGYVKATDIEFTVSEQKENQHLEMIDKIVDMSKINVGGEEIEGATIQVLDKDGNIIDEWVSAKEPHKINGLEENNSYILHEEITADGYVKATDIEFEVSNVKENQHLEMIDKIVDMSKINVGGEEIEGATIQVLDKDGNIIDEWVSAKEPHIIKGLEEKKSYILHEEITADGYVKATDIEFTVSEQKENQHLEMIDKIVEITKTDITNGNELEGAELEVTDEDGNTIDKWTSTIEPHKVKGLEEGKTYILKETTAPYGYEITEEIKFIVTTDKETQKVEMKDMPILKNVKVIKIDTETKEIIKDKFIFAIYEDPECTKLIKEVKSNTEDGTALFEDLRYGTYYIKEIKAPKDYELSNKIVKVEINDKGIFVDDEQLEEKDSTIEFSFENKKIEVPKTGDESKIKLFAGAAILSLLGIAYIVIHNHNKNKED